MIITDEMIADFKIGFHGSTLSDDQVKRGLGKVFGNRGLFDSSVPMADGGETPMTAAEEVLVWLLVEKIGVPDDVSYSPDQAQKIITDRLAQNPSPTTRLAPLEASAPVKGETEGGRPMDFTSDDEALEVLKAYGHEESQNGVICGDWLTFDEKCRAAVQYLINEWDFVFENVETEPEPDHEDAIPSPNPAAPSGGGE